MKSVILTILNIIISCIPYLIFLLFGFIQMIFEYIINFLEILKDIIFSYIILPIDCFFKSKEL